MRFTTSYHTQFPQYLRARFPDTRSRSPYRALRLVPWRRRALHGEHASVRADLEAHGFENLATWRRGVDTEIFKPRPEGFPRPAAPDRRLCRTGRRRKEHRRIPAICPGPAARSSSATGRSGRGWRQQYPGAMFTGYRFGGGSRAAFGGGGRHGVSEPHRYFRPGQSGGHGLRRAGRRLSRNRPHRCDRGWGHRGARSGPGRCGVARAQGGSAGLPGTGPAIGLGCLAAANSKATWCPAATPRDSSPRLSRS